MTKPLEKPILFSAPMIRAILAGTKTQTRRVVNPQPDGTLDHQPREVTEFYGVGSDKKSGRSWFVTRDIKHAPVNAFRDGKDSITGDILCPFGVGMKLRVKEAAWMWCEKRPSGITPKGKQKWHYVPMREAPVHYRADHPQRPMVAVVSPDTGNTWGWRFKVGRFLPLWASRITLEITGISVERLQDIVTDDIISEGAFVDTGEGMADEEIDSLARQQWISLWDSINGEKTDRAWASNPFVWKYTFRKL